MEERITYESKGAEYSLNPLAVMGVISDLGERLKSAISQAQENNPHQEIYAEFEAGGGINEKVLRTHVVDDRGHLSKFKLAELVLKHEMGESYDNSKLTLYINAHSRVVIPSDWLHVVARDYELEEPEDTESKE